MTVALAGRAPATFEIKSATLPLVALLLKSPDLGRLADELAGHFGDIPDFFDDDPLVIDLAPLQAKGCDDPVDFDALAALLRPYRVHPVAVRSGTPAQMEAALAAGLALAPDAWDMPARPTPPAAPPAAPAPEAMPASALVIDRPLRSGQQVYARGRDLVVLAMVNSGAEVIADGHIHVYAPLRGRAIAGARGDINARVFTTCLEPELVSIAGVYRTSETPWPKDLHGRAVQVRLSGGADTGKLVIEPLNPS